MGKLGALKKLSRERRGKTGKETKGGCTRGRLSEAGRRGELVAEAAGVTMRWERGSRYACIGRRQGVYVICLSGIPKWKAWVERYCAVCCTRRDMWTSPVMSAVASACSRPKVACAATASRERPAVSHRTSRL